MPDVEIFNNTWDKLKEFKKVVEAILEDDSIKINEDYIDLVLSLGLEKMISDLLPNDEPTLTKDIVSMFNENPTYISQHILANYNRGKESEQTKQVKENWSFYA